MGCAGSKLDDLPAVAFCRARSQCLDDAIRLRYALADAHADYLLALRSVGDSLRQLVGGPGLSYAPVSPVLPLPSQRKGDPMPHLSPPASPPRAAAPAASIAAPAATVHHISRSHSGSHLQFNTDTDEDEDDDDGSLHSGHSSPLHHFPTAIDYTEDGPRTYFHYAKKGAAAAAVSYEQPAPIPEVIQVGESSSHDGYSYPGPAVNYFSNSYPNTYPLPYAAYGEMSSFFGRSSPPPVLEMPPPSISSSTSKAPPPPPSPPSTTSWDFLNPFEAYDNYYSSYTPNRSYNAASEEEGIPDLENEEGEVIKEVYDQKFVSTTSSGVNFDKYSPSKAPAVDEDERRRIGEQLRHQVDTTVGEGDGPEPEYDSKTVEKNVVADEVQTRQTKAVKQSRVASEVVQEITALFRKSSESCDMASKMLEVGKLPHRRKNYQVMSSKLRNVVVPPISRSGVSSAENEEYTVFEEEKAMMSGNLSSTLKKLNMWEKKLCDEVKIEEKMRVLYERKSKHLTYLDERGAEADKIASTQASVKKLENKIRVAIQVISTISSKISMIRDEELFPQINELIQGYEMTEVIKGHLSFDDYIETRKPEERNKGNQ